MTPDALPPEAIDAAVKANDAFFDADGDIKHPPNTWVHELARVMLEAAAPHLAAAEREACAQLAESVSASYLGDERRYDFADLLRERGEGGGT